MTLHPFLFWMLLILALPGAILGSYTAWLLAQWVRIYWMGRR